MERILAVQRMQDYIEAHLQEEITPAGLAEAAHFSPWYARRLFELHTGLAPARYIRPPAAGKNRRCSCGMKGRALPK